MVPRESKGHSFKGAALYYLHDKGQESCERIEWTHTENLCTDDPERAIREMTLTYYDREHLKTAAGVRPGGRRLEWSVYTLSLSWHPEENPDKEHMIETGRSALKAIGMDERQALFVCHNDTEHRHVHMIVNRVHPETGLSQNLWASERKLSRWAERYEKEHSQKIYCEARVKNNQARDRDRHVIYQDNLLRDAWRRSDNGRAFVAALDEQGWILARGNRRDTYVAVAPNGRQIGLRNELNKGASKEARLTIKDIRARFSDLDYDALLDADRASARQKERQRQAQEEKRRRSHAPAEVTARASDDVAPPSHRAKTQKPNPERLERVRAALQAIDAHDRHDDERRMAHEAVRSAMRRSGRLESRRKRYQEQNATVDRQFDRVFRDGGQAREAFYAYESRHGFRKAVMRLQNRPQSFGRFNGSGLGFWRSATRKQAREALPELAQDLIRYQGMKKRVQSERRERENAAQEVEQAKARQQVIENRPGSHERQALLRAAADEGKGLRGEDFSRLSRREQWQLVKARECSKQHQPQRKDTEIPTREAREPSALQQEFEARRRKMVERDQSRDDIERLEEERRRRGGPGLRR